MIKPQATATIIGRVSRVEELTRSGDTAIQKFSVVVQESYKTKEGNFKEKEPKFFNLVAFDGKGRSLATRLANKFAAFSEKYGKMGMQIGLSVRLQPNSYKDKDGNTRYTMDLVVEDIWFDNAPSKEKEASSSSVEAAPATPVAEAKADVSEVSDEDIENLPFY